MSCKTSTGLLVSHNSEKSVVSFLGATKEFTIPSDPKYLKADLIYNLPAPSYVRKSDFTSIQLKLKDVYDVYDNECYIAELDGNLTLTDKVQEGKGTIQKTIIPYGLYRKPLSSPESAVVCQLKLSKV